MALVRCRECQREISDQALACPQCGDPRRAAPMSRGIRILLGVFVCILIVMFAAGILFAWLAPKASTPIDVYIDDRVPASAPAR